LTGARRRLQRATCGLSSNDSLTFTGERFLPGCAGEIAYEHWHRYAFARRFVRDRRVLDGACGEGYGTALLASVAKSVVGIDVDVKTIEHARATYGETARMRFIAASCAGLPLPSASIDVVVSFETIEHVSQAEQRQMLSEFSRVLTREGLLVISSPNKRLYSEARNYVNEFHVHELYREQLEKLLSNFPAQHWLHQRLAYWSGIWSEDEESTRADVSMGGDAQIAPYPTPEAMYFIVIAARSAETLPAIDMRVSLFTDAEESVLKHAESSVREAMRLDALLKERDAALAERADLIRHLELVVAERQQLVDDRDMQLADINKSRQQRETAVAARERELGEAISQRDRLIAERDAELALRSDAILIQGKKLAALDAERGRQEAALAAQERVISYLQSFRGWLAWPMRRLRQWVNDLR
jgi:ubiquinone/menaquinone biosynthesis C-methylase UbiE